MDDDKLKKLFENQEIPEPSEDARTRALKAAMEEFEAQKEKTAEPAKGITWFARLMGKTEDKGGSPIMNALNFRNVSIAATVAVALIVVSIVLSPEFRKLERNNFATRPAIQEQQEMPREVADADKKDFQKERPATATVPVKKEQALTEKRSAEPVLPSAPPQPAEGAVAVEQESFRMADAEMDIAEEAVAPAAKPSPSFSANQGLVAEKKVMRREKALGYGGASTRSSGDIAAPIPPEYVGRDQFEHKEVNPVKVVREEPVSTFSVDVDTASYSFVRRAIMEGVLPQKDAVRAEEMINYFDYDYEVPADRSRPFKPTVAVYPTPWNSGTVLLHIGIKGYEIAAKEKPRSNLVFLLDVSGSMQSADKLPLLKNSMRMLVDELSPEDTVAIVVYAGAAGTVLEPTPVKEKRKILAAIERLEAGGSTAGAEGIRQAYALAEGNFDKEAVNRVILATDGDFNVGITNREELKGFVERKRETGIYLSVLGFGRGNYNDSLMQALAQNGNGVAAYIDTLNEARKVLVDEASSTLFPIATDVKIQVEFNPARVAEYRLIGYETRMLKREDFNNDKIDAGDIGAGHTVTAIYEIVPAGSDARLVDDLRYATEKSVEAPEGEYAFLKIRYKLPGESTSKLITRPVGEDDEYASVHKTPTDLRFAASVAAFAQVLKGGQYTGEFGYGNVIELANKAKGDDTFGYRAEFVNLVRLAQSAQAMEKH